jgi:Rnl2 family RNA ligase
LAKRSGFLNQEKPARFFRSDLILNRYKDCFKELTSRASEGTELVFYGELYGGAYPHKEVPINNEAKKVQKEVYYSPNLEFRVFDLSIDGELIDYDRMARICYSLGLPFCEPLFRGSFKQALEYPSEFSTTIPALSGLPEIGGNLCEGVVLKPHKPLYFLDGTRVILKNKNEKFKEVSREVRDKNSKQVTELSKEAHKVKSLLELYVNENRLNNVISKIGTITQKDFGKVLKDLNIDTKEDFLKDYSELFEELDKEEQRILSKTIGSLNADLLKVYFRSNV